MYSPTSIYRTSITQTLDYLNFGVKQKSRLKYKINIRHDINVPMYSRVQCSHLLLGSCEQQLGVLEN